MNARERQIFYDLRTGDTVRYLDNNRCTCTSTVVGWKNHQDLPALLVGEKGNVVTLAQVLSRARNGAIREWSIKG